MNPLFQELLKLKAHIGKKQWNSSTASYLQGLRPSQRLFGNPSFKKVIPKNKNSGEKGENTSVEKSFQRIKSLKKRSYYVIFNLEKTLLYLSQSISFIQQVVQHSNQYKKTPHILFVTGKLHSSSGNLYLDIFRSIHNAKAQLSSSIKLSVLQNQWVGGLLTNWKQVSESLRVYTKFKQKFENFLYKHKIQFPIYEKYKKKYFGLIQLANTLPDLIIITNPEENEILIQEAFLLKIPIIALINSHTSPSLLKKIQYPIPGNNSSPYFTYFCLNLFFLTLARKEKLSR